MFDRHGWNFVDDLGLPVDLELVFVYGVIRTSRWAVAAYRETQNSTSVGISLDLANFCGLSSNVTRSWKNATSMEHLAGPQTTTSSAAAQLTTAFTPGKLLNTHQLINKV